MRILHLYRTYFPDTQGGLEETIRQICINTEPLGVHSSVFALSKNPAPAMVKRPEAEVHRAKLTAEIASCGMSLTALKAFKIQAKKADIIHYHFPWPFADFLHFAARIKTPSVLTYHSDIVRQRLLGIAYRPLMQRFLSSVDCIACTSPNYFATSDVLSHYEDKVKIIPIGINQDSYPLPTETIEASTRAKYGDDFFLFVGVLRYYKGLHILLDAIVGAPYKVVIVGSGPTENSLKKQAEKLGINNVIFAGRVSDEEKVCLFNLSRAVVFPSYLRAEAFGVTLLEGAMFRKPLISTEVGSGTSHVNKHNETGLVVTPGSKDALRRAMDKLYSDAELCQTLGEQARRRYEEHFTGALMGVRYHAVYQQLLQEDACSKNSE